MCARLLYSKHSQLTVATRVQLGHVCVHSVLYLWLVRGVKDEGPQVCPEPGGAALPAVLLCCCAILLHNHYTRDMKTKQRMGA